jgi:hypothetical protein
MGKTYGDALCSTDWEEALLHLWQADAPGSAYFCHLQGTLPAGGEFVEPFSVQYSPKDKVPDPELHTMHEPLVVAPEHLVVPCILDRCSPPALVDEVHVLTS